MLPVAAQDKEVVVMLPAAGAPYFKLKTYGYLNEGKKLGYKVSIYDAGGFGNLQQQITQIEDAITRGVSAIVLVPASSDGTAHVVEKAAKAGIPVVNDGIATTSDKVSGFVGEPSYVMSQLLGAYAAEKLAANGKIAMLTGPGGLDLTDVRTAGFKDYISKFTNMHVVAEKATQVSSNVAMNTMQDFLQANPDISAVYTFTGSMAVGVVQALRISGRNPGDVVVLTADLEPETKRMIEDGWIQATVISQPVEMARIAIRMAVDAAEGKQIAKETLTLPSVVTAATIASVDLSGQAVPEGSD